MLLCAITDRKHLEAEGSSLAEISQRLCRLAGLWTRSGVQFIQLREKDLDSAPLTDLARGMMRAIRTSPAIQGVSTKLLINAGSAAALEVALTVEADGIHLPGRPQPEAVESVRQAFRAAGRSAIVSLACHGMDDAIAAGRCGADFALFSPVFSKRVQASGGALDLPAHGLDGLRRAVRAAAGLPVLALGGVTAKNAADCVAAGAAGVAGIGLFLEGENAGADSPPSPGWRLFKGENHI